MLSTLGQHQALGWEDSLLVTLFSSGQPCGAGRGDPHGSPPAHRVLWVRGCLSWAEEEGSALTADSPAGLRNLVLLSAAKPGPGGQRVQEPPEAREPEISVFWLMAEKQPDGAEALFGKLAACLLPAPLLIPTEVSRNSPCPRARLADVAPGVSHIHRGAVDGTSDHRDIPQRPATHIPLSASVPSDGARDTSERTPRCRAARVRVPGGRAANSREQG